MTVIELMIGCAPFVACLAALGLLQAGIGAWLALRFRAGSSAAPRRQPAVTVLKPLHGDEPLLEAALATLCRQDYPALQIVFGVQSRDDGAVAVVNRLRARFPAVDMALVVDPTRHGPNHKIGNLINMLPAARHGVLAIADSDLHVAPDYVSRLVAALELPGTGLVTVPYAGLPAADCVVAALGGMSITHYFLPGALLARGLGRQDCLGATMMLRRETLARIGGLEALVDHLADDNALGRLVRGLGLSVRLAATVAATTVPETRLGDLYRHELRWARTIRALEPVAFAASSLQYPIVWAALALGLSGGADWAAAVFLAAWLLRYLAATCVDRAVAPFLPGLVFRVPFWLLPARELMSIAVMIASYGGDRVVWRGHTLHADGPVMLPDTDAMPNSPPISLQRD